MVVSFSSSARFIGTALLGSDVPLLHAVRVSAKRLDEIRRVRILATLESALAHPGPVFVVLVSGGPWDELVREAARRHGLTAFELSRDHVARVLGATAGTVDGIRRSVVGRYPAGVAPWSRRPSFRRSPRSDLERHWEAPVVALGAALAARAIAAGVDGGRTSAVVDGWMCASEKPQPCPSISS